MANHTRTRTRLRRTNKINGVKRKMTLLIEGLNRIRDLIATDLEKGEMGTGGTAPTTNDTDLETADSNTIATLAITKSDRQVNAAYVLLSTEGTTTTYKEFKSYNDTNSVDYDRIVFTGISFTTNGTEDINITKRYFVSGG